MVEGAREYRIHEPIGRGGFGTVYRAELVAPGGFRKPVALKVLNSEVAAMDEVVRRLRDEARMLALVRHSGIIHVDGLFQLGDRWAVVMELFAGVGLNELLRDTTPPPRCAFEIIGRVADALHAAHSATDSGRSLNLIHRDVKPSNILVGSSGEIKVFDFGVARADIESREAKTQALFLGTPEYMAPERWLLKDSQAVDVYSLGAVLFEVITGRRLGQTAPEQTKHDELVEKAQRSVQEAAGPEVADLLGAMLSFDPEGRPTARQVERACRDLLPSLRGSWLRDWAEQVVPRISAARQPITEDPLSGTTMVQHTGEELALTEVIARGTPPQAEAESPAPPTLGSASTTPAWPWRLGLGAALLLAVGALVVSVLRRPGNQQAAPPPVQAEHADASRGTRNSPEPMIATPLHAPASSSGERGSSAPQPDPIPQPHTARQARVAAAEAEPAPGAATSHSREQPAAAALPPTGHIEVSGDATSVRLRSGAGTFSPGEVPAGSYIVVATFEGRGSADAGKVTVEPGATVRLFCDATFAMCRSTP